MTKEASLSESLEPVRSETGPTTGREEGAWVSAIEAELPLLHRLACGQSAPRQIVGIAPSTLGLSSFLATNRPSIGDIEESSFAPFLMEDRGETDRMLRRWHRVHEETASRLGFLEEEETHPHWELGRVFITLHERLHRSLPWDPYITEEERDTFSTKPELRFEPQSSLGRRLWNLRQEILSSGRPALSLEQVREEVARRRGQVG